MRRLLSPLLRLSLPSHSHFKHFLLSAVLRSVATEHEQAVVPHCCVPVVGLVELVEKESFKHSKVK